MGDIFTYLIKMRLAGRLTQLPDSQKIFGALMYLYSDYKSADRVSDFVSCIKEKTVHCTLSDMLPQGYLPLPQSYLLEKAASVPETEGKQVYKALKERQYIKEEQMKELLGDPGKAVDIFPYITIEASQQIHASIDSLHYQLPGLDPNLYSVPEVTVVEAEKERKRPVKEFCFYLSLDQSEYGKELLECLEKAQNCEHLFFLGPRASQGMNTFSLEEITAADRNLTKKGSIYLNMGMLLPDKIDICKSYIKLFTSKRYPYHNSSGWDKNQAGKYISFIQAGSLIYSDDGGMQAGKSIESPYDSRTITFGNAFLIPLDNISGGIL